MFGFGKKNQQNTAAPYLGEEHAPAPSGHVGGGAGSEIAPHGVIHTDGDPRAVALPPTRGDEDDDFQFNVRQLPEGVIIKRVFPRDNKRNKQHYAWRAGYQAANGKRLRTEYYGETLDLAIADLFRNHENLLIAYNAIGAQQNGA